MPSGNVYITRHCRTLTKKSGRSVHPVYLRTLILTKLLLFQVLLFEQRSKSRKRIATTIGLHAPSDIFQKVKTNFEARKVKNSQNLWHRLHISYPKMPAADKNKVHRLILSKTSDTVGEWTLFGSAVHAYIRDRHTRFKSLRTCVGLDREADFKVNQRVKKILASWRGED